jgi:hypothetical protein
MLCFVEKVRHLSFVLVCIILVEMIPSRVLYAADDVRVENIRVERSSTQVIVLYDLVGSKEVKYTVALSLRRENAPEFKYIPKLVRGDCGESILAGSNRKIIWNFGEEMPGGQSGDDFYIVVDVATNSTGISPLVWIGGGVAAVAATALLLLGKKGNEEIPPAAVVTFPPEPGRPR